MKEMTGSGIFVGQAEDEEEESGNLSATPNNKTGLRMYQVHSALSKSSLNVRNVIRFA